MPAQLQLSELADAYSNKRQRVFQLIKKYGIAIVSDPDAFLEILLEKSPACKLRTALANPGRRAEIKGRIQLLSEMAERRSEIEKLRLIIAQHQSALVECRKQLYPSHYRNA